MGRVAGFCVGGERGGEGLVDVLGGVGFKG